MSKQEDRTFLMFRLADESYVVPVTRVDEVLEYVQPTVVPRAPAFLMGIINVRGRLIPVLNLRERFGMPHGDRTVQNRIVILDLKWEGESVPLGVLTDAVEGVIDLAPDALSDPPGLGTDRESAFLKGTARFDDRILMVLDVDEVLRTDFLHRAFSERSV